MSETPSDKEPDAAQLEDWYWADGRDDVTLVSSTAHVEGLRAVFNAGRASVTPPTGEAIAEAEKEAVRLLKPKQFRVIKREIGFTVETPVVDYWEAVHELARALAVPPTESEGK